METFSGHSPSALCRALMLPAIPVQHALLTLVKPAVLAHGRPGVSGGGGEGRGEEQLPWRTRGDNGFLSVTAAPLSDQPFIDRDTAQEMQSY